MLQNSKKNILNMIKMMKIKIILIIIIAQMNLNLLAKLENNYRVF